MLLFYIQTFNKICYYDKLYSRSAKKLSNITKKRAFKVGVLILYKAAFSCCTWFKTKMATFTIWINI